MGINSETLEIDRLFLRAVEQGIYKVTEQGTVYNNVTKRFVATEPPPSGEYCRVSMSKATAASLGWPKSGKSSIACAKNRLVYLTFKGSIPESMVIHHRDGDPTNNALSNLRPVSESFNSRVEYDKGRRVSVKGDDHYAATMLNEEVVAARWAVLKGETTVKDLAAKYKVAPNTITTMLRGSSYPTAGGPINLKALRVKKVPLTAANEELLRDVAMAFWRKRFKKKRKALLAKDRLTAKEKRSIYARYSEPQDLSGACKIVSQMALLLFPIEGEVISNKNHTFVLRSDASIYDINSDCEDVRGMKSPYRLDWSYHNSREAKLGLGSWHTAIVTELLPAFNAAYRAKNAKKDKRNKIVDLAAYRPSRLQPNAAHAG